jgi:hypothetical protein
MRRAAVLVSLLAFAALAGCGDGTEPPSAANQPAGNPGSNQAPVAPATTGAAGQPTCPDLDLVASHLGMTLNPNPLVTTAENSVFCQWSGRMVTDNRATVATVSLRTQYPASDMVKYRQQETESGHTLSERAGVGDEAFTFSIESFGHTINNLVVRKGDRMVYIGSLASLDEEVGLARLLLA